MSDELFQNDEALGLADILIQKPLSWRQLVSGPSSAPVLRFVKFRVFSRAVTQYRSLVLLLRAGQWEDALILARSLYELNLNLSEISGSADPGPEDAAKRFVKFGNFQSIRLEQKRLEDLLRDERLKSPASVEITDCEGKLAEIAAKLNRDFAEFRTSKGKWRESWSGVNVETLAQRLAKETGGQGGQNDYYVFKLGSLFTHSSPGSLFFRLPRDRETIGWNEFRAALDNAGRTGLRHFLHEASVCLVDIVGIAGDAIAEYERKWFDEFAVPLLGKL
jgi:hypothetical protein